MLVRQTMIDVTIIVVRVVLLEMIDVDKIVTLVVVIESKTRLVRKV